MASLLTTLSANGIVTAPVIMAFLGLILSALALRRLTATAPKFCAAATSDIDAQIMLLDLLLPQTQCGQCGHLGCRPYAEAILHGAATNLCPPGGEITARRLARAVNDFPAALNPAHMPPLSSSVARIREDECIGCTKCIQACPTDAIFGAAKRMHSIIEAECNGCDLCVDPCPVDCIDLVARNDDQQNSQRRAGGRP
jgi:Na+-translocating ferredoxin:NAD+ oxidoreductase subunit B